MDKENKDKGKTKRKRHSTNDIISSPSKIIKWMGNGDDKKPEFREGSIRRLILHNFLTFDDVVLEPSPQLNVIVAPNGTGKSSLVCAMCLVLCGHTSLLGRAKDLKDFVKHGKAKDAFVEIMLHHKGGNHPVIKRVIYKERNGSKWFLNGRDCQEKEVKEVAKRFNVQLENKCQFLPQDKVVEFAKLDTHQLLDETEKAIGAEDMYTLHQQLKGMKDRRLQLESSLKSKDKLLTDLIRTNRLLEMDVNRIKKRKDSQNAIKHLTWKKCWTDYEECRIKFKECKDRKKQVERASRRLHHQCEPLKNKMKQNEVTVISFGNTLKDYSRELSSIERKIEKEKDTLKEVEGEQQSATDNYEHIKKESNTQKEKIKNYENQINSLQTELSGLPDPHTIDPQVSAKNQELRVIAQEITQIQTAQHDVLNRKGALEEQIQSSERELSLMEDHNKQRMDTLYRRDQDAHAAIKWLRENKSLFHKTVHEPILMLLHIKDMSYADQIENVFSGRDLFSFIFESREDRNTFASEVRDKMNLKVNMVIAPSTPINEYQCSVPIATLQSFGFNHMLMDLIEAPGPVLAYFCTYYQLHNIPLAKGKLNSSQLSRFKTSHPNIQRFYTADQVYTTRRSRYRNETISKSEQIRKCQVFLSSSNEAAKQSLLHNIETVTTDMKRVDEEMSVLKEREMSLRQEDNRIRQERNNLRESLGRRRRLQQSIDQRNIQLRQLVENPIKVEEEFERLKQSLLSLGIKKEERLKKLSVHIQVFETNLLSKIRTQFNLMVAKKKRDDFESEYREVTNKLKEAEAAIEQAKIEEERSKNEAKTAMDHAKQVTGVETPSQFSPEITDIFLRYPEDSASLEELIHEHEAQVAMHATELRDPESTIIQFEDNEAKIRNIQETIEGEEEELRNHESITQDLKNRWLGPLTGMIEQINTRFSQFFKEMNCMGEVGLLQHENDYSKYGVQIRVKFRSDDELHVLDSQHQSGGERSVSTMLYLMALQEITNCSFRVVDEINQGMDSNNERRVFDQIVSTVSRKDTSQYFLLTPKLLRGLHYTPAVTLHIIHNGPKMVSSWDSGLYLS